MVGHFIQRKFRFISKFLNFITVHDIVFECVFLSLSTHYLDPYTSRTAWLVAKSYSSCDNVC